MPTLSLVPALDQVRPSPLLLELDLTSEPLSAEPEDPIGKLRARSKPRLRPILRALHEAGDDPRVRGLIARVGGNLPWAMVQELRDGVRAFARSGKPTVAWAETLGEGGNGSAGYLLASAFGEIWLQPSGELGLHGVAAETTFLRGALDKAGVEPQISKRYEYKSAADRIMNTGFTEPHRQSLDELTSSVWTTAVAAIAASRSLPVDSVRESADRAPLSAADARTAGLIDQLGYRDQAYAAIRARIDCDVELLFADRWTPKRMRQLPRRGGGSVALVDGHGGIAVGASKRGVQGQVMGSDTVSAGFRAARDNDHVKAVVFRVDSPGGSAVASDTIWREVELTRQAGKPVIVSMGALAASGGYYVSCSADRILAQPATLTGSIGVFGGKIVVADLLDRIGLNTGAVAHGAHARMFSTREPFSESETERLDAMLDEIYETFLARVAAGRSMTRDQVHEIARGRVWTGADARQRGLVDELGGLRDAVRIARSRAGLREDAPVRPAVHVPPLARLRRPRSSDDPRAAAASASARLSDWGDLRALATAVGLPASGALTMPPIRLR